MAWQTTQPSLLRRLRDPADEQAWNDFDRRYGPTVLAYCRSRGLQLADAEDVRQIVLVNLARSDFRYEPGRGRFRDYLGTAVRNAIRRHMKGHGRASTRLPEDDGALPHDDPEADALWEREWVRHHYRRALDTLRGVMDGRSIEIFELLLQVRSAVEVAAVFDTTPEAVRKVKQRVRAKLRDLITEQVRSEEA